MQGHKSPSIMRGNLQSSCCSLTLLVLVLPMVHSLSLPKLNIDRASVVVAGFDDAADFAHQFHISFSSLISGACAFGAQPFHCAVSHFSQDKLVPQGPASRVPFCDGCPSNMTLPFDHCKTSPSVVDVGSTVDFPRRHCGQNPISIHECIDDVDYVKKSRVFLYRGTKDDEIAAGTIENTAALLAQMMDDPSASIKVVNDQPTGHYLPLTSDGYDGPGNCLRHVYDAPWMAPGIARDASWTTFDQLEFLEDDEHVGFQDQGWVYVPSRCRKETGDQVCKLVVRPGACDPPSTFARDVHEFAAYAESNAMVILHPCMGGPLDSKKYPNAQDVKMGRLDVYGQLGGDYVHQSAPHMRAIGKMVRRLLGIADPTPTSKRVHKSGGATRPAAFTAATTATYTPHLHVGTLPTLNIDRSSVLTAGCSNTADFAHQLHVAYSSIITGSCIFSGMPYHCAVTRFPNDYMVPKTAATAAGIHCPDCDPNGTLIYDHCKNHPHWVDIDTLAQYAETASNVDDPRVHLAGARVFSFGPTHDRCYQPPAMENVANFHLKYARNRSQVMLVEDQPFPHTLPTNSTPYFNDAGNTTGAGYDGPGECLKHVVGHGERLWAAPTVDSSWWLRMNVSEFVPDRGVGMKISAWLFLPPQCKKQQCKLLILPGGCNAFTDSAPGGSDGEFAKYGAVNGIVILKPCQGGPIDTKRFPANHENLRGMVDVYGQISANYATQTGSQMGPIGSMIKRIMGQESSGPAASPRPH